MRIELTAFPYDSEVIRYESDGMPVYDRAITSKEYRNLFLKYFTEGVFPNPSDNFQIVENSSQGALVKKGYANVRGVLIELKQDTPITFEQADSLDRIDRVVLRHNDTKSVRYADVVILKGSPSNSPQAPNITRDETIWDIVLADVRIRKNSSNVTQAQITDRRLDSELCGIVAGTIKEVDTTTLYNQIQSDLSQFKENEQAEFLEWFEKIKGQLGEDAAGNLQNQIFGIENYFNDKISKEKSERLYEIEVERQRINQLTKLGEGSTTGDAELQDIRVGFDGKMYANAGESVRTNDRNILDFSMNEDFLDLTKSTVSISHLVTSKSKISEAYLSLNEDLTSGNGGLTSIDITEKINTIECDIEFINSIVNIGVYYFVDNSLKIPYEYYVCEFSDKQVSRHLNIKLDWNVIEQTMKDNGYTSVRFVCWFGNGSKKDGSIYIKNLKINGYTDMKYFQKEMLDFIEKIPLRNVINKDIEISNTGNMKKWLNADVTITNDETLIFNHLIDTGNTGFKTIDFKSKTGFVIVEYTLCNIDSGAINLFIGGTNKNTGDNIYLIQETFSVPKSYKKVIDVNYLSVYTDIDISKPIYILFGNKSIVKNAILKDIRVYENEFVDGFESGKNLTEILLNLKNEINKLFIDFENLKNNQNENELVSPNGIKYVIKVSDNGELVTIPVIPNKTLFIGNSLLLGFQEFGMCAQNSKSDYYHYVSEFIKKKNQHATFDRLRGSGFEECISQEQVDLWIKNNLQAKVSNNYDLILVQLGDNVNNTEKQNMFKTSCKYLLKWLRTNFHNSRVCWIAGWYTDDERQNIEIMSCQETGSEFVNIRDLNIIENQGKIGDEITYDDGHTTIVNDSGVASHPSNKGMKAIADRIIDELLS